MSSPLSILNTPAFSTWQRDWPPFDPIKWQFMRGQPLTLYEREEIAFYARGKMPLREMAKYLHRSHSAIVRELGQNRNQDGMYRSSTGHERALKRRHKSPRHKLDDDDVLRNWVVQIMHDKSWSPAMIAGKLGNRPEQAWMKGKGVSHVTIYQ